MANAGQKTTASLSGFSARLMTCRSQVGTGWACPRVTVRHCCGLPDRARGGHAARPAYAPATPMSALGWGETPLLLGDVSAWAPDGMSWPLLLRGREGLGYLDRNPAAAACSSHRGIQPGDIGSRPLRSTARQMVASG